MFSRHFFDDFFSDFDSAFDDPFFNRRPRRNHRSDVRVEELDDSGRVVNTSGNHQPESNSHRSTRRGAFGRLSQFFDSDFDITPGESSHVQYSHSVTTSTGPGGIKHVSRSYHDSRNGLSQTEEYRTLGDKTMKYIKSRDREGREQSTCVMENMDEKDRDVFESEWTNRSQSLPTWHERVYNRAPRSRNLLQDNVRPKSGVKRNSK
ncbi:hypothetical protein GEMRC1_000876 [Eukaryota sp. GEM-RC1]